MVNPKFIAVNRVNVNSIISGQKERCRLPYLLSREVSQPKKCTKFLPNPKGQVANMKSTEPESRVDAGARKSLAMQFQENVALPAVAIRENAHLVGRTASTSSFLTKHSTALRCLGFRLKSKL